MPIKSKAQWKYFMANQIKLRSQGVDLDEYFKGVDFKKLPEHVSDKNKKSKLKQAIRSAKNRKV